jgi:transposase
MASTSSPRSARRKLVAFIDDPRARTICTRGIDNGPGRTYCSGVLVDGVTPAASADLEARIVALEVALAAERARAEAERARAEALTAERDRLLKAYQQLDLELKLLRRRIFVANAERIDTRQLELEFASKQAALEGLTAQLGDTPPPEPPSAPPPDAPAGSPPAAPDKPKASPKGRRNLSGLSLEEERVEVVDPELEGKAPRAGFEESYQLGWRKGGPVRIVIARAKYRITDDEGAPTLATAPMPRRTFGRCLAAPSLLAKIVVDKFSDGLPLYRQEQRFEREGIDLDRGTMCRWVEDAGMTAGCVVMAMKKEALETAFCIATDATGVAVQPEPSADKARQPCRRGHFFVMLADRDHVLFEYMPRETSAAVAEMFRGYAGYVQADAKSVYDVLFRAPGPDADNDTDVRYELGCWSHGRRKFYEAAIGKDPIAREALWRIHKLFELERTWSGVPPATRKTLRAQHSRPLVDAFFAWAEVEYDKVKDQRGMLRSAFGYVLRQRDALRRFLDDGRLPLDNNGSERELRRIAVGRKAWLFVGSDDHAEAAANLFSLIASCKLHGLDPEAYLRDLFRVLAHWPKDRYLELAPRYWASTRARLDAEELKLPLGHLSVPQAPAQEPASR